MEDLAALHVVLVVDSLRVEPVQVLRGRSVGTVVLQDLLGDARLTADVDREAVAVAGAVAVVDPDALDRGW